MVSAVAGECRRASGGDMRFLYVCYAAVGYAVARWLFKRDPQPIQDPVSRLRTSGLL
jgi:hypothetical protein